MMDLDVVDTSERGGCRPAVPRERSGAKHHSIHSRRVGLHWWVHPRMCAGKSSKCPVTAWRRTSAQMRRDVRRAGSPSARERRSSARERRYMG